LLPNSGKFPSPLQETYLPTKHKFMAGSQVPCSVTVLGSTTPMRAWKSEPSFYLVVDGDHMIPVEAQRAMAKCANATVMNTKGSHAIYVSNPKVVAALIEQAAKSVATSSK
jgi:hypothetical protein